MWSLSAPPARIEPEKEVSPADKRRSGGNNFETLDFHLAKPSAALPEIDSVRPFLFSSDTKTPSCQTFTDLATESVVKHT